MQILFLWYAPDDPGYSDRKLRVSEWAAGRGEGNIWRGLRAGQQRGARGMGEGCGSGEGKGGERAGSHFPVPGYKAIPGNMWTNACGHAAEVSGSDFDLWQDPGIQCRISVGSRVGGADWWIHFVMG